MGTKVGTPMSLTDKIKNRTFPTRDVTICLDAALSDERDAALADLAAVRQAAKGRLASGPTIAEAKARLERIEERMRASLVTIRIAGMPFQDYNKCIHANPPRKGKQEPFNTATFFLYTARRSAKYVNDNGELEDISDGEWAALENTITDGEHDAIANAVVDVNRTKGLSGLGFLGHSSATTPSSSETSDSPETSA